MSRMTRNKNGKDDVSTSADLDEEMEKVFDKSGNDKLDLRLPHFATDNESDQKSQRRYNEGELSYETGLNETNHSQTCINEFYKNTTSIEEPPHKRVNFTGGSKSVISKIPFADDNAFIKVITEDSKVHKFASQEYKAEKLEQNIIDLNKSTIIPRNCRSDSDSDQLSKNTALFYAIRKRQKESKSLSEEDRLKEIEECLSNGADINAVDKNNKDNTVLHLAVKKSYKKILKFLLKYPKIDICITNIDGKTAKDLAQESNNKDIIQLFIIGDQLKNSLKRKAEVNIHDIEATKAKVSTGEDCVTAKTEYNSLKIQYTSSIDAENDLKSRGLDDNDEYISLKSLEPDSINSRENTYHKGGLVHSLHGHIYQLKLQMLFLKRALEKNYDFNLGTEVEDAEKFDDILFKYRSEENEIRFVQAKHKIDESKKISAHDLLTGKNDDFSLQKYFISYRKIKQKPQFDHYRIKDLILFTNINFDFDDLIKASIQTENIKGRDDILEVKKSGKATVRYRLIVSKGHDLYEKLRETSDLYLLAKELSSHISKSIKLKLDRDIFKLYHAPLSTAIFEIRKEKDVKEKGPKKYAKFCNNFVNDQNLSEDVSTFRKVLQLTLGKAEDAFKQELLRKELAISLNFGEVFKLQSNPTIIESKEFAEQIVQCICNAPENNIITIKRHTHIKNNIDKLAGHVFVQDEVDDGKNLVRFREIFFDDNHQLDGNLGKFKDELKLALKSKNIDFNKLGQYKYKINSFQTCEEKEGELLYSKLMLPNDKIEDKEIENFFAKLVFAVNQPGEVELGKIIAKEIGEDSQFNLLNADLVADSFQSKMLHWFKTKGKEQGKEGVWLNKDSGQAFFNEIAQELNSLISIGLGLAYREKLQAYGIKFDRNDIFDHLKAFLYKEQISKSILHLIPQEETIFSAIKIDRALEDLKQMDSFWQYIKDDSFIFMKLSTLLLPKAQKRAMDSFKSVASHNLFIIDCASSTTENEILGLYEKLSTNLSKINKKIILLAKKDHTLVKKFLNDEKYEKYESKVDCSSFHDLTQESQKKLLEQEVVLQGKKVGLNKLIDPFNEKMKEKIDVETFIKLIKGEEIIVGSKLEGLGEVGSYYINRRVKQVILDKQKIEGLKKYGSKSDLFVISGIDCGLKGNSNIYVFAEAKLVGHKFKELCENNIESNIHWLEYYAKKLTWCKSYGSISNLIQCKMKTMVIDDTRSSPLRTVLKDDHKIVIISDIAGMGKSIALTNLSMELKEEDSSQWVIRINLNDYTQVLEKELQYRKSSKLNLIDVDINETINFLLYDLLASQEQVNLKTNLEQELFKNGLNSKGKIVLLFDGFDEISPDYKDIIIDLLHYYF